MFGLLLLALMLTIPAMMATLWAPAWGLALSLLWVVYALVFRNIDSDLERERNVGDALFTGALVCYILGVVFAMFSY